MWEEERGRREREGGGREGEGEREGKSECVWIGDGKAFHNEIENVLISLQSVCCFPINPYQFSLLRCHSHTTEVLCRSSFQRAFSTTHKLPTNIINRRSFPLSCVQVFESLQVNWSAKVWASNTL